MKVILISGKAQHGKDTSANIMQDRLISDGKRVLSIHYADLLKHICRHYFQWNGLKDVDGRKLLQRVGTDVIRKENPDFWVDFIITILSMFKDEWDFVIIPDCRFPNEIEKMREKFDTVYLRVNREGFDNGLTKSQKNHPSETALDKYPYDYEIVNKGEIENLIEEVNKCVEVFVYDGGK